MHSVPMAIWPAFSFPTAACRWHKNLRSDFGGEPGVWAYSESPLIDGDTLVCTPGGKDATMVALNKKTGETIWKAALPDGDQAAYASAIVATIDGVKQYVQFVQKSVVGLNAKTGALLWNYGRTAKGSPANIPTPVADGKFIYTAAGMSGGGLVKIDKTTDTEPKFDANQVYFAGESAQGDWRRGQGERLPVWHQFASFAVRRFQ